MDQPSTELLAHLSQHPSWKALKEAADEKRDLFLRQLTREIVGMAGGTVPAEELQYIRGYLAGMKFLLESPDKAAKTLRREELNASVR